MKDKRTPTAVVGVLLRLKPHILNIRLREGRGEGELNGLGARAKRIESGLVFFFE